MEVLICVLLYQVQNLTMIHTDPASEKSALFTYQTLILTSGAIRSRRVVATRCMLLPELREGHFEALFFIQLFLLCY